MKFIAIPFLLILFMGCSSSQKVDNKQKKAMLFYNQGTQELQDKEYGEIVIYINDNYVIDEKINNDLKLSRFIILKKVTQSYKAT